MKKRNELVHYVESAKGFDNNAKLKLTVLAAGLKPATFVSLRITKSNLEDKAHFEKHLREEGFLFRVSRPRSFEEITGIKKNAVQWGLTGVWFGYDIFADAKTKKLFDRYVAAVTRDHKLADALGGKLYGYPQCCIRNFLREHDLKWLKKNYSCYEYYKRLNELDRAFPFLSHTPCSRLCARSKNLNVQYRSAIKQLAPRFFSEYTKKKMLVCEFIRDSESDVYEHPLEEEWSIWPVKDGHEYTFVASKPLNKNFYLFPLLVKESIEQGTVFTGKAVVQYDFAIVTLGQVKRVVRGFHHRRKLPLVADLE